MKDSIILQGKTYISARRAAKKINYAQDYVGQLCRAGKLDCTMIGRSWFVTEESLFAHRENAIDTPEQKESKATQAIETEIKTAIADSAVPTSVVVPVVSPLQSFPRYEAEKKSLLPELNKKVPLTFSLPKNVAPVAPRMTRMAPAATLPVSSSVNPVFATVVIVLIASLGFLFTTSLTSNKNSFARNEASVGSVISGVVSRVMQSLGLAPRTPLATTNTPENASTGNFNGIGITPSVNATADDIEKEKIRNSFSDEVSVLPDESGTAGVVKPVFKKTDGKDFVYVLVPVKEKKQ